MRAIRHIFLILAGFIFIGHSLVPHTHLSGNGEETFHQHDDDHQDLGDLIVCFFQVDHDSEDLDNFFAPDADTALPSSGYTVIPKTFFEQQPPTSYLFSVRKTCFSTTLRRGPPAA